jgi:phage-related protein
VVSKIKEIPSKIANVGTDLVRGIWNGISGSLDWIKGKITGWVGNVTGFIKKLFGIKSPSTVMRDQVGKMLAEGIAVGFGAEMPDTLRTMQKAMSGTVGALRGSASVALDGTANAGQGGSVGSFGGAAAAGSKTQTVVFNQYNTSPKALDRLTVYRDTKSLLFSAKVGLSHV